MVRLVEKYHLQMIGEIDDAMLAEVTKRTRHWSPADSTRIELITPGGDLSAALGLFYYFRSRMVSTAIIRSGCYSAGTIVALGAETRQASKSATFLIHFGEESASSKQKQKLNKHFEKLMREVYMERMGATAQQVGRWLSSETYWTPEKALKNGLIMEII